MKSKRIIYLLILLILLACVPGGGLLSVPTATPSSVPVSATPSLAAIPISPAPTAIPRPLAERVLIVSFDGLRPDAIGKAPMTNLLALMQTSAYTLTAQTILPSVTLPAHASMLSGLCPSGHGVYWNDYIPENGFAVGADLFDIARAAGLRTVMVVGKEKLRHVTEPASTDVFIFDDFGEANLAKAAVVEIEQGFGVMFVHFPSADYTGHEYGWLSKWQLQALRNGDTALGQLLAALDASGQRASTLIIVTSDHGGHKKTHGSDLPEDLTIPWIVSGPGVLPGPLTSFVHTTDTAATAAYLLGLPLPAEWDGRPVTEAFGLPIEPRIGAACQQTR
jgi:arylsulfatase A-like enzyme